MEIKSIKQAMVRVFDSFESAGRARDALLADGFPEGAVALDILSDEAGPVEGNFTVGNSPVESEGHVYASNYANPVERGHCVLAIEAGDPATAARADAILVGFGARNPDGPR